MQQWGSGVGARGASCTDPMRHPPVTDALSGLQKAAILLVSLGPDLAAEVFRHLDEDSIETLSLEMAKLEWVGREHSDAVMQEMAALAQAYDSLMSGGVEYAEEVLRLSLGPERAAELMGRLTSIIERRPFELLRRTAPEQIIAVLQAESPQTVALVVAHLHASLAARVLSSLPAAAQTETALRIAQLEPVSPEVVRQVEAQLRHSLATTGRPEPSRADGVEALADILTHSVRSTERNVLDALDETDPELAEEIRRHLFTFEDIVSLDDRSIQAVLRESDQKDLVLALRGVSQEIRERLLGNLSARAAQMVVDDLESQPPQRRRTVEDAQGRIVAVIRRLEEEGTIILARDQDEIVV